MIQLIGIDPGTETGVAKLDWATLKLSAVESMSMITAQADLQAEAVLRTEEGECAVLVVFEDARAHKVPVARQKHKGSRYLQGIGSVKRDCNLWEEFLTLHRIPFITKRPSARMTKWTAEQFARVTGWTGRTNNHGRDAGCLIWGMNRSMIESLWRQARAAQERLGSTKTNARPSGRKGRG